MNEYIRTRQPYTLNEVLYITDRLIEQIPIDQIAGVVQRTMSSIIYKFVDFRPLDKNGEYIWDRSVKTLEEVNNYKEYRTTAVFHEARVEEILEHIENTYLDIDDDIDDESEQSA